MSAPLLAQRLSFITGTPNIDSFPVVKVKFTASYNGFAPVPTLNGSQFVVKEDNVTVPAEVVSCDGVPQSAVVFCSDASTSMISSVGNTSEVYDVFYRCFGSCIELLPSGSRYSLITFYDHNIEDHPGLGHVNGFYDAGSKTDSADFVDVLKHLPYFGGTYVDEALDKAIELLRYQPFASRAIVLVTDDAAYDLWHFDSLMKALNITLYVMEVGSDTAPHDIDLAYRTGGAYFQATDSTSYEPVMSQIGELIGSEHCFLRYVSPNKCPWYASHSINMSLTHQGLTRLASGNYTLFRNYLDSTGPLISETAPFDISRLVTASEFFPCERGLYFATDSIRENISLRTRKRTFNHFFPKINGVFVDSDYFSMQDSLVAIDTMQPGRAVYTALDSAGNESIYEVLYKPKPDTFVPLLNQAFSSGGKYTIASTEARAWDIGLSTIRLASGAVNLVLDSVRIFNRRTGNAYVRILDLAQPAHGCIEAVDSVGNVGSFCIDKTIGPVPSDLLPPVIKQDPILFPKPVIAGRVTELQPKDKGIKIVTIEPAGNIFTPSLTYNSSSLASFSVGIVDTLQPVRAWISATDSAGNTSLDTLRYDPLPDNNSPVCMVDAPNSTTRIFHASELAPWDRGIESVTIVGTPTN
ncbi:MAG TPA: vWA domain-containing protein, partial [Candidatus Kapabacteria bacterium]|nr:vWA domain-containing protein [Candidatus Kapabacteria bacterium]